jgi:hypothetical protein
VLFVEPTIGLAALEAAQRLACAVPALEPRRTQRAFPAGLYRRMATSCTPAASATVGSVDTSEPHLPWGGRTREGGMKGRARCYTAVSANKKAEL